MSNTKRFLSAVMAFVMVLSMFSGLGGIFAKNEAFVPTASAAEGTSKIKSYADLAAAYDNFIYLGLEFYEEDASGNWVLTDYYVDPGQSLKMYFYIKTDMYLGAGAPYIIFERSFFDVTNGATNLTYDTTYDPDHKDYPTKGYPAVFAGTMNPNHSAVLDAGVTVKMTTNWARNVNGFKAATQTNWHGVDLAESDTWDFIFGSWGRDATGLISWEAKDDAYYYEYTLKVREFMPDGVTKLAEGTTGFVKNDHRMFKRYDPSTVTSKRVSNIAVAPEQINYGQMVPNNKADFLTLENILIEDQSHTFTIGKNPADVPAVGTSKIKSYADLAAAYDNFIYLGLEFYEQDTAGDWFLTDYYVQPGQSLKMYFYIKTDMYLGAGAPYIIFERSFFDVTNGATNLTYDTTYDPDHKDYPTKGYPAVFAGTMNPNHSAVLDAGVTVKMTTNWARNVNGFKAATQTNWHGVDLAESDTWDFIFGSWGRDATGLISWEAKDDAYYYEYTLKVREFMPDGVTKLADGTTGFVKNDHRMFKRYDPSTVTSKRVSNIAVAPEQINYGQMVPNNKADFLTLENILIEDQSHTFTIGNPPVAGSDFTATFTVDGEQYGDVLKVAKGGEIAAPATDPVKAGYAFKGWALEGTTDVLTFPQTMGDANVTYVAIFEELATYTATFMVDGAVYGDVKSYYAGDAIVAPADPSKTGYTFAGWNPTVGTMGEADVVFNATWTAKTYTATFLAEDVYDETVATFDQPYILPEETPVKEGYTFAGWYADEDCTEAMPSTHTVADDVIFYAKWDINSYTITFDVDGGSAVAPITAPFGSAITEPAAPTKNGYTFAGWSPALPATMPAENITVKAQWTAVASGIQLMDGDAEYDFIEGVYGDQITSLPTLTKDGFTFNGWTYADGSAVTYPITLGTAAITVYAKWTAKSYYIDFYGPGEGDWITGSSQYCGDVIVTPDAPSKAGYQFIGWADADGNPMPSTVPAIDNQAYYAQYEAISYDALFLVDGEEYDKVSGIVGTSIAAPTDAPAKEGHTFKYWAKAGTTTKVNFPQTMPINGVSYDAIFDVNTYTVTWVVDGTEVGTTQVKYGETITDFAYTAPEGSSFGGWLDKPATMPAKDITVNGTCATQSYTVTFKIDGDAEFEQVLTFAYGATVTAPAYEVPTGYSFSGWDLPATMPAQNIVLTATLTANTYYAIFYLDDDMTEEYAKDGYNYGDTIVMPEAPTKPGYTFDGWDNDATTMGVENEVYVAMWTAIPYNVVFNAADGSVADEWVAYYGDVITEDDLPEVTKEGFDFSGWKVDGEYVAFPYTVTGNVTFEPAFGTHVYTITYYVDGEVAYTDKYEFGAAVTARPAEVKEGYTFSGWDVEIPATMPANDITVKGTFTVNQYDAKFYADGVLIDTVATNFGEIPVAPEAPAKVGYTFVGWTPALAPMTTAGATYEARYSAGAVIYTVETYTMGLDGQYGAPEVETKSAEADAAITVDPVAINGFTVSEDSVLSGTAAADGSSVLKVYYIRNQYTFKTVVDGVEDAKVYYYGADVAAPADPAKTGYTFTGWDGSIPATMPARDVTLTARFTINQYTITFAETGDKVIPSITQDYGTAVVAPANPTKTGYTFAGWDKEIPATIPAEDITITAQWTINQYTITFAETGDTVIDAITNDYGTAVVAPADPTKVGYTFAGWDKEIPATIPAENITITALWTINQYDAIFVIDGKEVVVPTDYNTVPVAPEATKYGYSFTGWDKEIVAIGTEAVTYTAQFAANTYNATFTLDGGNIDGNTADVIVPTVFDQAVVSPADPVKEGYIFAGWTPAVGNMTSEDGIVYTATWTQNLDYCRVQSVERVTADVYEAERALYEIKVMGSPVKLQVIYADNQSVTWTYDRNDAKVADDLTASGLVKIVGYTAAGAEAGEGDAVAYEIWTICTVLTEGNYKVRAKVDYSSTSWESIAFAYDYVCEYDKMPVDEDIITSATGPETIKRGTEGTIVIVAAEAVTRMRLKMDKGDGTYTTVSYAPNSTAVKTETANGKTTWTITITFTYSGTAESQQQNWVVWYRTADVAWTESEYVVPVKVTRYATVSENAGGHAPYSVISVSAPADTIKGETTVITIVTTNDISRIKLSYDGRSSTYLKTSNNVSVVEDAAAGTYTWTVNYKFGVIADGQVWSVQCRGTSWSTVDDGDKFTINVASNA